MNLKVSKDVYMGGHGSKKVKENIIIYNNQTNKKPCFKKVVFF